MLVKIKKALKSKTIIFNLIIGVSGSIEAYSGFLSGLFSTDSQFGVFMVVVASIGVFLRSITTTPLSEK